jgi:succinate dehydrogenase / fumarate reductase cytochrome b subunit
LIYAAEAGLAGIFLLHAFKAITNWTSNRGARPVGYQRKTWAGHTSRKTVSSTTMIVTGVVTLVFTILHLKTFKFGPWYVVADEPEVRDLHRLVLEVFQSPAYVVFYVVCMALIFMHLRHGLSSALQSIGVHHPRYETLILRTGAILAAVVGAAFALVPVWAYVVGGRS